LDTSHTSGNAQQKAATTPSVIRIVGHLLATLEYSIIFWLGRSVISTLLFEIASRDAACNVEKVRLGNDYLEIVPYVNASNPSCRAAEALARRLFPRKLPGTSPTGVSAKGQKQTSSRDDHISGFL
jgi:hypothetical protein